MDTVILLYTLVYHSKCNGRFDFLEHDGADWHFAKITLFMLPLVLFKSYELL